MRLTWYIQSQDVSNHLFTVEGNLPRVGDIVYINSTSYNTSEDLKFDASHAKHRISAAYHTMKFGEIDIAQVRSEIKDHSFSMDEAVEFLLSQIDATFVKDVSGRVHYVQYQGEVIIVPVLK